MIKLLRNCVHPKRLSVISGKNIVALRIIFSKNFPQFLLTPFCSQQAERQLSIPAQREALQAHAERNSWNIVEEYVDEARSAKSDVRDYFQRMIADARKPSAPFQAILVHKFDRFSRSRADHVIYKALLKKQGIFVFSATEPTEPDTPHGMLMEGMLEVISEFYNINLKHETLKGMRENAEQGFHCGGRAPFGYRLSRTGSKEFNFPLIT